LARFALLSGWLVPMSGGTEASSTAWCRSSVSGRFPIPRPARQPLPFWRALRAVPVSLRVREAPDLFGSTLSRQLSHPATPWWGLQDGCRPRPQRAAAGEPPLPAGPATHSAVLWNWRL